MMGSCTKPAFEAHVPCPLAAFDAFPALLSMCKRLSVVILFFLLHGGAWYVLWLMCCLNLAGWMCVKPRNCIRAASVIHLHLLKSHPWLSFLRGKSPEVRGVLLVPKKSADFSGQIGSN